MENYDNSFEDYDNSCNDFDNSCGDDYCDSGDYGQSSGSEEKLSFNGCLNNILILFGIFGGIGMLLTTLILFVPKGNMEDILGGFAVSAIGLLALWWVNKREKNILSNLIKVILSDMLK